MAISAETYCAVCYRKTLWPLRRLNQWNFPVSDVQYHPHSDASRSGFDSRRYQIFWEVVGLERGPLSLVITIIIIIITITPWPESLSELYRPSDGLLSVKLVPTFACRGSTWSSCGSLPLYSRPLILLLLLLLFRSWSRSYQNIGSKGLWLNRN
jgi:hypothetical protein